MVADYTQYHQGLAALDDLQWGKALAAFQAMSASSAQAEGALYWKAFALYRAGKGTDAAAPLAELRKSFPNSGWLHDAGALGSVIAANPQSVDGGKEQSAAVRQQALEDRMNADAAHAPALLREAVLDIGLPGFRQKALYFLSKQASKESRDIVLQVAHGAANPDLQAYAISQLGKTDSQAVFDLYPAVDAGMKALVLSVLAANRESARLLRIAGEEKDDDLRYEALSNLVDVGTDAQVTQALAGEKAEDVKMLIQAKLNNVHNWVAAHLNDLQHGKDSLDRRMGAVGLMRGGEPSTDRALVAAYSSEKDEEVKGAIIFALGERRNYAALQNMDKTETNAGLKLRIEIALQGTQAK